MSSSTDLRFPLASTGPSDRYFDYCLEPYRPRRPTEGKLRAENLLWLALDLAGCLERARPLLEALRTSLGRDMTVWGVKFDGKHLFFEFYVYDPRKEEPLATATNLARTLAPFVEVVPTIRESIPYMMVSFDLDREVLERGRIESLDLYLTGSDLHEGRSYRFAAHETPELRNLYRFLEPKRDIEVVLPLLTSSATVDFSAPRTLAQVLLPDLFACRRVCVAKKRQTDGVYFSGIDVDQLASFVRRFAYPQPLRAFLDTYAEQLDHLYFDVGIDYAQAADGRIVYPKTSFYGTL